MRKMQDNRKICKKMQQNAIKRGKWWKTRKTAENGKKRGPRCKKRGRGKSLTLDTCPWSLNPTSKDEKCWSRNVSIP